MEVLLLLPSHPNRLRDRPTAANPVKTRRRPFPCADVFVRVVANIISTCSPVKLVLLVVTILSVSENTLSTEVDVAGIHKYFLANFANTGMH